MFDTLSDKAEWALKVAASGDPLSYDTETSGLDWKRVWPVGYVFCVPGTSVYVPLRHGGGGNLMGSRPLETPEGPFELHPFEVALKKAFAQREETYGAAAGPVIGHNLKFDMHMSLNAGVILPRRVHCTQYGAAMLDEHARSHSLEISCLVRGLTSKLGQKMYDHLSQTLGVPNNKDSMGHFWRTSGTDPVVTEYTEGDGISTLELWKDQTPRITAEGMDYIASIEMRLMRHIVAMERRGVKIDEARLEEIEATFKAMMLKAMEELPDGFNSRAPTQAIAFFTKNGVTNWPTTDKGNPSFPEKWLKTTEPGRKILKARKVRTILDQFIEPMKASHVFKGRVHPSFNQLRGDGFGVVSGRFSCSYPNLQQVPKHNRELAEIYRSIFLADEGFEFWEADYSQCEPRLFAHYAKSQILIDGYNSTPPMDMHDVTAKMMNADRDTVAKRMNMGLLTGMWPKTFATHMGWDLTQAKARWNEWMALFPEIRAFQDGVTNKFGTLGYVRTILGRRCRLDNPKLAYQGTSRVIQGSNADILKAKMLVACEMIEQMDGVVEMLLTVHDSLNWQAEATQQGMEYSRELVQACSEVQVEPFNLRVPFVMDVKKGKSWSEATFGKKIKWGDHGLAA